MRTFHQREHTYSESLSSIFTHFHRGLGKFWFIERSFQLAQGKISLPATERALGKSSPFSRVVRKLKLCHAHSTTATTRDAQFNDRLWKNETSLHSNQYEEENRAIVWSCWFTAAHGFLSIYLYMASLNFSFRLKQVELMNKDNIHPTAPNRRMSQL